MNLVNNPSDAKTHAGIIVSGLAVTSVTSSGLLNEYTFRKWLRLTIIFQVWYKKISEDQNISASVLHFLF